MTDHTPIPPAEFADAVDRLDRDALARFVARLEATTADDATVDVEPPVVTVREGDVERTIVVAPDGIDDEDVGDDGVDADTVVVGTAASAGGIAAEVRTPDDLRRRLLYALPPEVAERVAEEWLAVPARAASYERPTDDPHGDGPDPDRDASEPSAPADSPTTTGKRGVSDEAVRPSPADEPVDPDPSAAGSTSNGRSERPEAAGGDRSTGSPSAAQATVVVAMIAVLLGGVGGVVYVAELSPDGDAGAFADTVAVESGALSGADIRRRSREPIDESGAITSTETMTTTPVSGGEGTGRSSATDGASADRNVRPFPTCNRSPTLVVQIQLNALKYNNDTTNDGIRTVRRFASPRNRQTIETFDEFVRTIQSPTYNSLLSYDTVQYTPSRPVSNYAQIRVVTRENDSVTGQYYFRLRQVEGGQYDGCWMTDAVVATPETTNASGLSVAHPEGKPTAG